MDGLLLVCISKTTHKRRKVTYITKARLTRSQVTAGQGRRRPDSLFLQVMSDRGSQYLSGERAQRFRDTLTLHYVVTGCKSGWRHQLFKELIRTGPASVEALKVATCSRFTHKLLPYVFTSV